MNFRIDQLHRVLYKPRSAFEDIKSDVTWKNGLIIGIILIALGTLISNGITIGMMEDLASQLPATMQGSFLPTATTTAVTISVGIIVLFITALFGGWIASSWADKELDKEKTVGVIGYSTSLDLVQSIVMSLVMVGVIQSAVNSPQQAMTSMGAISILGILFFIWSTWVKGTGIAVANDTTTAKGIVGWLIASIIVMLIVMLLSIALGPSLMGAV